MSTVKEIYYKDFLIEVDKNDQCEVLRSIYLFIAPDQYLFSIQDIHEINLNATLEQLKKFLDTFPMNNKELDLLFKSQVEQIISNSNITMNGNKALFDNQKTIFEYNDKTNEIITYRAVRVNTLSK